jgi:hypothetical protein
MAYLYEQLKQLLRALEDRRINYALCGGLALAVHGLPRATVDIDILVQPGDWPAVEALAKKLDFTLKAGPMSFSGGAIEIRRVSKIDPQGNVLTLDVLLVTDKITDVWDTRREVSWEEGRVSVVSREGLIRLKRLSGRPQDIADIARLEESRNNEG